MTALVKRFGDGQGDVLMLARRRAPQARSRHGTARHGAAERCYAPLRRDGGEVRAWPSTRRRRATRPRGPGTHAARSFLPSGLSRVPARSREARRTRAMAGTNSKPPVRESPDRLNSGDLLPPRERSLAVDPRGVLAEPASESDRCWGNARSAASATREDAHPSASAGIGAEGASHRLGGSGAPRGYTSGMPQRPLSVYRTTLCGGDRR